MLFINGTPNRIQDGPESSGTEFYRVIPPQEGVGYFPHSAGRGKGGCTWTHYSGRGPKIAVGYDSVSPGPKTLRGSDRASACAFPGDALGWAAPAALHSGNALRCRAHSRTATTWAWGFPAEHSNGATRPPLIRDALRTLAWSREKLQTK